MRMAADLVDEFPKALAQNLFPANWLSEAADEIERLRKEEQETFLYYRKTITECDALEAVIERLRAELANRKVTLEIKAVKGKNFDVNKIVETFKRLSGGRYE